MIIGCGCHDPVVFGHDWLCPEGGSRGRALEIPSHYGGISVTVHTALPTEEQAREVIAALFRVPPWIIGPPPA